MADVKWIKITTDIFDDEKMLLLESMPSADSIIVIWFKLLTFAGKQNNDGIFLMSNKIAYTDEMLATIFRREVNTVKLALKTFEQFGMIEIVDNIITIPNWNKHQTLDAYEKKKERDRLYQAERRAKQLSLIRQSSDKSSDNRLTIDDLSSDKSSDVAISDKDRDKEREKELEQEEDYIFSKENILSGKPDFVFPDWLNERSITAVKKGNPENYDFRIPIAYLNQIVDTNYKYIDKNTKLVKARFRDGFILDDFKAVIDKKADEWLKTDMSKYLRPETLFGSKFESYLNQPEPEKSEYDDLF